MHQKPKNKHEASSRMAGDERSITMSFQNLRDVIKLDF